MCQCGGVSDSLVLAHSPLVGPVSFETLATALRDRGYQVFVPDLTGALTSGPPYRPGQVDAIVGSAEGREAILVGHSGAGPLLASAGSALDRVAGYLFIDAGLPRPGQSWMDTAPPELADQLRAMAVNGWLPPWSQWWGPDALEELIPDPGMRDRFAQNCPRLPLAMFEEEYP